MSSFSTHAPKRDIRNEEDVNHALDGETGLHLAKYYTSLSVKTLKSANPNSRKSWQSRGSGRFTKSGKLAINWINDRD